MEVVEFLRKQAAKGGKRRKETTTPEQRAEWGRKGGKLAGRGRPKEAEAADQPKKKPAKKAAKRKGK
jgi:general stress protein YciG